MKRLATFISQLLNLSDSTLLSWETVDSIILKAQYGLDDKMIKWLERFIIFITK